MMSKRKPSILYSRALSTSVSIISFSIMRCSLAVSAQQEPVSRCRSRRSGDSTRNHLVQIGVRSFARSVGVIEDHILDDAQASGMQALDHGAIFAHAIIGIDGIAAFRRHIVHRIVAPVISILTLDRGHRGLLLLPSGGSGEIAVICQVDLSSLTLAKWNEGMMCTAFSPLRPGRADVACRPSSDR